MLLATVAPTLVGATGSLASDSPAAGQASASALPAVPHVALDPLAGIVTGRPIRAGFVGLSLEFPAVLAYAGADPASINPVLVRLIRQLTPGASPVLRIGGDSTDWTWLPVRGASPPAITSYRLTPAWIRTTRSLVDAIGGRLILGVNLAMLRPALAGAEGRAFTAGIGASRVAAFEIGNEADVYRSFPRYRNAVGAAIHVRNHSYTFGSFTHEFSRIRRVLPDVPTAGPAFGNLTWMKHLRGFIASEPGLGIVTFHRYPLSCFARPGSPKHASIANLMTPYASRGLARTVAGFVALAHARGLRFRVDELNSVSCGGVRGVSDTFASALWALDTLFELAKVGVDGVNVHTLPGVAYEPFSFTRQHGRWSAVVHPMYYGLLMFARATPPGARLLPIGGATPRGVKLWATVGADQAIRYVLINKSGRPHLIRLRPPLLARTAALEQLRAPSLAATSAVTIGGQTFGPSTDTGTLSGPRVTTAVQAARGSYAIPLAAHSASLLTVCGDGCTAGTS